MSRSHSNQWSPFNHLRLGVRSLAAHHQTIRAISHLRTSAISVALFLITLAGHGFADATGTWITTTSGGLWSNAANWQNHIVATGANGSALFDALDITTDNTVHLDTPRTIAQLVFADTTPSNNWFLDNNGNPANVLTMSNVNGVTPEIDVNNQTATISATIAGNQGILKGGNGTLVFGGKTTYTGTTTIQAGTLQLASGSTLGSASGQLTLTGGSLNLNGTNQSVGGFTGQSGTVLNNSSGTLAILTVGNGDPIAFNGGTILADHSTGSGTLALTKAGTGIQSLSAPSTYSGGTTINGGTLIAAAIATGDPIGTGPLNLAGGTFSIRAGLPIATSSYNQDLIYGVGETSPKAGSTTSFDGVANTSSTILYQAAVPGSPGGGLPANGVFVSNSNPNVTFQMQPYKGMNAVQITGEGDIHLVNPASYKGLAVLASSAFGPAQMQFTLVFTDNSSTSVTGLTVPDWFRGPPAAISGLGAVGLDGTFDTLALTQNSPSLYEIDYTLSAADQTKTLSTIEFFAQGNGSTTKVNVFGVSSLLTPTMSNYLNQINVTADSTIDVENSAGARMGNLAIGSNTLTITNQAVTSSSFSLVLGTVNLSGNPTLLVSNSLGGGVGVVALGAINDGGVARTITLGGGGTFTLATPAASLISGTHVSLTGGILNSNNGTALGTTAQVDMASGATFNVGAVQTIDALSGAGNVILNKNLTIGGADNLSTTFSGKISGAGTLNKIGAGILALSGIDNTQAGNTVSGGVLVADNTACLGAGSVTLNGGVLRAMANGMYAINGFGGSGTGWTVNSLGPTGLTPFPTADTLQLTSNQVNQGRTAFFNIAKPTSVNNSGFVASFTYTAALDRNGSGMTFMIQNDPRGLAAIGDVNSNGLTFAYGGTKAIVSSLAVELNIDHIVSTGVGTSLGVNGSVPPFSPSAPVNPASGDPVNVVLTYNPLGASGTGALTEQLTDTTNQGAFSMTWNNVNAIMPGSGFVGFSGATSSDKATQNISNFRYILPDASAPVAYVNNMILTAGTASGIDVGATGSVSAIAMGSLSTTSGIPATLNITATTAPVDQAYDLNLGAVSLNTSVTFNVANNGNGLGTLTLGAVSGTGFGITKGGPGLLMLPAVNTYTGNTTVESGVIQVTGSLAKNASSSVSIAAGSDFTSASLVRRIQPGGSYAGLGSTAIAGALGVLGSSADIRLGMDGNSSPNDVAMQWRVGNPNDSPRLVSDVLNLTGMSATTGTHVQTDPFVLQMTYNTTALNGKESVLAAAGLIDLAWLDTDLNQPNGLWVNATSGNFGSGLPGDFFQNVQSSWDAFASSEGINAANLGNFLGSYGVDTAHHTVWAVVNHNSEFSVVPEPASWLLLVLGTAAVCGMSIRRKRAGRV